MTKASDNEFPSVLFDEQGSNPSTPASGFWRAFFKSDGLYVIDDAGVATGPLATGGGAAADLNAAKVTRTNVGSNITVASTTWQDMDSTNLTITMSTGARRVLLALSGRISNSGTGLTRFGFSVDGTPVLAEAAGSNGVTCVRSDANGVSLGLMVVYLTDVLSAASHTFRPRWNCSANTTTAHQTASTDFIVFSAHELYAD